MKASAEKESIASIVVLASVACSISQMHSEHGFLAGVQDDCLDAFPKLREV
jgi:hypothetical protein